MRVGRRAPDRADVRQLLSPSESSGLERPQLSQLDTHVRVQRQRLEKPLDTFTRITTEYAPQRSGRTRCPLERLHVPAPISSRTRAVSAGKARSTSDRRVRSSEIDARNYMIDRLLSTCCRFGLTELDQVSIRIAQVTANLAFARDRRGQKGRAARAP